MENELREQPISSSDLFLQSGSMAFNAEVAETEKEKKRLLISGIPVWKDFLTGICTDATNL